MTNWQPIGDAAQRVVESCGADVGDHNIKMKRELNRQRRDRIDAALGAAGELLAALTDAGPLNKPQVQLIVCACVRAVAPDFKWDEIEAAAQRVAGNTVARDAGPKVAQIKATPK